MLKFQLLFVACLSVFFLFWGGIHWQEHLSWTPYRSCLCLIVSVLSLANMRQKVSGGNKHVQSQIIIQASNNDVGEEEEVVVAAASDSNWLNSSLCWQVTVSHAFSFSLTLSVLSLFMSCFCDPLLFAPSPCLRKFVRWIGCCTILPHLLPTLVLVDDSRINFSSCCCLFSFSLLIIGM